MNAGHIDRFYSYKLPSFLLFIALLVLAFITIFKFFSKGDFSSITIYFAMIALVIALASVTFSLSNTKEGKDREVLIATGEMFLHASISLISSLLISWLSFTISHFLEGYSFYKYIFFIISMVFSWGQTFLLFAAIGLHKAIVSLENYLWFRVRVSIRQ